MIQLAELVSVFGPQTHPKKSPGNGKNAGGVVLVALIVVAVGIPHEEPDPPTLPGAKHENQGGRR